MFRDLFDPEEWSAVYDSGKADPSHFPFRHGSELAVEECLKRAKPDEFWVDVGSGTGDLAAELARGGLRVTGVDHDTRMVETASRRFADLTSSGKLRFVHSSAARLPFTDNSADGIIATSFMGCLDSPEPFYREASRILKANGKMVLTFTNRSSLLLRINGRLRITRGDSYHLYSGSETANELRRNDFEMIALRYYNFFLNPGKRIFPGIRFALFFERLGHLGWSSFLGRNFLVVVRKK